MVSIVSEGDLLHRVKIEPSTRPSDDADGGSRQLNRIGKLASVLPCFQAALR